MNLSQVIAKAHVPESDAMLLRKGDKATISASGLEKPLAGTVSLVSPALDPNSTTVEIWVQAANAQQQLRPGMAVQLAMTARTAQNALVIPASALLNANGDTAQVMVVDSQSTAHSRDVKLGIRTEQEAQIVEGLKPGEQVITAGAYGLPDKTKVKLENPAPPAENKPSAGDKPANDDKD
jgi:RND family efflux transporter MFP subunit